MLQVISPLKGFTIKASDGGIGTVVDFLFDDTSWKVRWLVIDCGTWLTGRKVLIHPSAISRQDLEQQEFVVALTKAQVEGSPELVEDQPVSRQMENQLYTHYGWDPLWCGSNLAAIPGAMASPLMAPPYLGLSSTDEVEARGDGVTSQGADPHLRSVVEVTGYRVHALDGEIGHIENLMIDDADWSVHYLIVDTRNWWFGKHVLISPIAVKSVDWFDTMLSWTCRATRSEQARPGILSTLSVRSTKSSCISTMVGRDPPPSCGPIFDGVLWPGSPRSGWKRQTRWINAPAFRPAAGWPKPTGA